MNQRTRSNRLDARYQLTLEQLEPRQVLATVLGTGTTALLGGDLTDPENDGSETGNGGQGSRFNWVSATATSEPNFSPGGPSNEGAFDVFDNKVGSGETKWCCSGPDQSVAVEFDRPYVLTHFTIASGNDVPGRDPDVWEIQGSNDGNNWNRIFRYDRNGTSPFTQRLQVIRYDGDGVDFATPPPYTWFRYEVTSVVSSSHQINELEFFGFSGLSVVSSSLEDGAIVADASTVTIDFSSPINQSTVQAGDLQVNGIAATSFSIIDEDTVRFTLPALSSGEHTMTIADGAIDAADPQFGALTAFSSQFTIPAHAVIINSSAKEILSDSAIIGANILDDGGDAPDVTIFWGTTDGGTEQDSWQNALDLGEVETTEAEKPISGLTPGTRYFYRAMATNMAGDSWASLTSSFQTTQLTLPSITTDPVDTVGAFSALVAGQVTDPGGDPPEVTIYYGTTDGGTEADAWEESAFVGERLDDFSLTISGLTAETTYFYRALAENGAGPAWSSVTRSFTTIDSPLLVINEFMAINNGSLTTRTRSSDSESFAGERQSFDWVEIHNATDQTTDIGGLYLTDNEGDPNRWQFPFSTIIPARGYLVVFASGLDITDTSLDERGYLHTNFSLDGDGEYLAISSANGATIHEYAPRYPQQLGNLSYGLLNSERQYLSRPTPGSANSTESVSPVADTTFSVDRGFYDEPFHVEIASATPDASIRYTTDGSAPSESRGTFYSGPVVIDKTTTLRAIAYKPGMRSTNVDTQTYIFVDDVITQSRNSTIAAGFPSSWNGTSPDYGMDRDVIGPSDDFNGVYAATIRDDLKAIPTLSIVTSVDSLFGSQGIYSNPGDTNREVATSVELITADGSEEFQINGGIKIQGGAFRSFGLTKKKSFRLKFKSEYGPAKLDYPFFGPDAASEFDTITLRMEANDGWQWGSANDQPQYARDEFGRRVQLQMGQPASHGRHVHLYLNGIYWGLYNAVERPDQSFGESYIGGDKEDWDGINSGRPINADDNSARRQRTNAAWSELLSLTRDVADAGTQEAKTEAFMKLQGLNPDGTNNPNYEDYLDVENMIDYLIVNYYGGNSDWPFKNYYVGRENGPDSTGFKFFMWDAEWSLDLRSNINTNRIGDGRGVAEPFQNLRSSEAFRLMFADRVQKHFFNGGPLYVDPDNPNWDPDHPERNVPAATYAQIGDEIFRGLVGESARWGDQHRSQPYTRDREWQNEFNDLMNNWFPNRSEVLLNQFRSADLFPDLAAPLFEVNGQPQRGGPVALGDSLTLLAPQSETTIDTVLLTQGHPTVAFVPTNGSLEDDNGPRWYDIDFNPIGWTVGTNGVGYEDSPADYRNLIDTDVRNDWNDEESSVYSRFEFDLPANFDSGNFDRLTLRIKYDDGFVAYLNGDRVASANAPGSTDWQSNATRSHSDGSAVTFSDFSITSALGDLKPGKNVLAIHGLNVNDGSSDMLILPELVLATVEAIDNAPIYYTTDGSDPRAIDGTLRGIRYTGPLSLNQTTTIRARTFNGQTWSAIDEATFAINGSETGRIVISEINYNPYSPTSDELNQIPTLDNDDFEFLEFHNPGATPISLAGLELTDGVEFDFPNVDLAAGSYAVVVKDADAFALRYGSDIIVLGQFDDGSLANNGETIELSNANSQVLLRFDYDSSDPWSQRADGDGASLELTDNTTPVNRLGKHYSWEGSSQFGGTPGRARTIVDSVVINEVLAHTDPPITEADSIEIYNPTPLAIDIGGWYLSDSADNLLKYRIPDGTEIGAGEYVVFDESHFNPTPLDPGPNDFALSGARGDDVYLVQAENGAATVFIDDVHFPATANGESFGRSQEHDSRLVPMRNRTLGETNSAPRIGPILISELHFHPAEPSAAALALDPDLSAGDLEFIELFNPTNEPINLANWRIRGGVDFDFGDMVSLSPDGVLLVLPFNPANPNNAARFDAFLVHHGLNENDAEVTGGYQGQLSNEGEAIKLLRPDEPPVEDPSFIPRLLEDEIVYDSLTPWPTNTAATGNSLNRISTTSLGSVAASWRSASASPGVAQIESTTPGDFDGDGDTDVADVDLLCAGIRAHDLVFDLTNDGRIDDDDLQHMINEILGTSRGDANLDGRFDSSDLVEVFQAGQYEDNVQGNSTWATGDWNCDGDFDTSDLVAAFQDGGYVSAAGANIHAAAAALDDTREVVEEPEDDQQARLRRSKPVSMRKHMSAWLS